MLDPSTPTGFAGYCIDLLDMLAATIGFQYNISLVPDGRFGNLNEDGSWNGVVREIIGKRADIGLGAMSVMAERENVIDFTVPYYDLVGIAIMMKIPHVSADYFRFLSVMEADVWMCILLSYVLTSVVLWLTDRLSPFSYQNSQHHRLPNAKPPQNARVFDLKESMWFCLMSLTPQGGGQIPRSMSSQCVVATWWMYGYVCVSKRGIFSFIILHLIPLAQIYHSRLVHRQSGRISDRQSTGHGDRRSRRSGQTVPSRIRTYSELHGVDVLRANGQHRGALLS